KLVGRRIDHCFTRAEKKPNCDKQKQRASDVSRDERGCGSEDSPPNNSRRQHAPRTKTVGKVAANRLKQRVTRYQRTKDFPQLHVRQMVSINYGASGDGNVNPVEIRNGAQDEKPE